nr:MAG TPA: baseplate assembly protein [Caudoviricetes sp.]
MPDISTIKDLPDISFIEYKTVDDVKTSMVADYEAYMTEATGKPYTLPRVSRDRFKLYAAAAQIYQAMKYVDIKGKMDTVKYSVGDFLDLLGAFRCGATRNQAAAAVTTIRFTLSAARASVTAIPQGTRIAAGQLFFATSVYTEIPAGDLTADIPATCMTAGETGNGLAPGELKTLVDPVPYVQSVENTSTSSGGADSESDESFAARIFIAPGKYSTAGSRNGYEYHVQDYSSAIGGVHVSSGQAAGTVDIVFVMADGSLPSAEMISAMSQHMSAETLRPMNDLVTVRAPAEVKYTVSLTYYINQSDNNRAAAIQQAVSAAVDSYIAWQRKIGRDINPSKLLALVMGAGAKRAVIRSPAFTVVSTTEAAQPGTVNLVYGGLEDD